MYNEEQIILLTRVIKSSAFLITGSVLESGGAICVLLLSHSTMADAPFGFIGSYGLLLLGAYFSYRGCLGVVWN
jgi:hypothetical protein